jgi:putative transposase
VSGTDDGLVRSDRWLNEKDREAYKKFLIQKDPEIDEKIRRATSTGRPLGCAGFLERIVKVLSRKLTPGKAGRPRKK